MQTKSVEWFSHFPIILLFMPKSFDNDLRISFTYSILYMNAINSLSMSFVILLLDVMPCAAYNWRRK